MLARLFSRAIPPQSPVCSRSASAARRTALLVAATAAFSATPAMASDCGDRREVVIGPRVKVVGLTTDQRLISFSECSPDRARSVGAIRGLQAPDTSLIGIDFRVQDGGLYGVGNAGGIYLIDSRSGNSAKVSQLTVALEGTSFGVDFNPAADRLRIVSNTGQNLRHNVNAGGATLTDLPLNYAVGTPAAGITGAAYTNNDLDANTGTSLFDIDSMLDQVVLQSPPNDGRLAVTGKLTVDADTPVGFDIYTRLVDGVAVNNDGYASLVVGGTSGFYRINFLTGEALLIETFLTDSVTDIAVQLDRFNYN